MKTVKYTVIFELKTEDHTAPVTFQTAMRMAIRDIDARSLVWLNDRIVSMNLVNTLETE